jgi:hypothetical protein
VAAFVLAASTCIPALAAGDRSRPVQLAQSGSTGGSIGKTNKSISGGDTERRGEEHARKPHRSSEHHASGCNIAGKWTWSTGGTATIKHGGKLSKGARTASWTCSNDKVVLVWSHGFVDHLTLSEDGRTLSGTNNLGYEITASRKDAE